MKNGGILVVVAIGVLGGCATEVATSEQGALGVMSAEAMPGAAATAPESMTEAYDPFAGEMPDLLVDAHTRVLDREPLDIPTMRALWEYAQSEPSDARPWLILARDSMNQDAHGFAVSQYREAFEADAQSAEYAAMLRDVLGMAMTHGGGYEYRESVALLVDAWGERALPAIDALMLAMHEEGDLEGARKLAAIRAEVVGG